MRNSRTYLSESKNEYLNRTFESVKRKYEERVKRALESEENPESVDDIQLTGDTEKDFKTVIEMLRNNAYEDLPESLEDIVEDPKLYTLLSMGFGDGRFADATISNNTVEVETRNLLPSQSEIGLDNSLAFPLKSDCSFYFKTPVVIKAPILTYNNLFIIDGHHRWSQTYCVNPQATMTAINFNYKGNSNPYIALRVFQGAIAVANKEILVNQQRYIIFML